MVSKGVVEVVIVLGDKVRRVSEIERIETVANPFDPDYPLYVELRVNGEASGLRVFEPSIWRKYSVVGQDDLVGLVCQTEIEGRPWRFWRNRAILAEIVAQAAGLTSRFSRMRPDGPTSDVRDWQGSAYRELRIIPPGPLGGCAVTNFAVVAGGLMDKEAEKLLKFEEKVLARKRFGLGLLNGLGYRDA